MHKLRQRMFRWPVKHGGARKGAGRKRQGEKRGISHKRKVGFSRPCVVHVTCKLVDGIGSLRDPRIAMIVMAYLARVCVKRGFRLVEYSIQWNHLHLVCEADTQKCLSRAMQGIKSGLARILNRETGHRGAIFSGRYHTEVIKTPTQCRNLLRYVLHNCKKHGGSYPRSGVDPYSTAPWFPFSGPSDPCPERKPAAKAQGWLLGGGWRRGGKLLFSDSPHKPRRKRAA